MKYVRKFNNNKEYEDFIMSESFISPNVSKVKSDLNTIKYEDDAAYVNVTYNISTTESATLLAYNSSNSIEKIILDNGITLRTPSSSPYSLSYKFNTTGLHTVKVIFRKIDGSYVIYPDLAGNPNIVSIKIPGIFNELNPGAFGGISNLTELKLPPKLTIIPSGLLGGCTHIKTLKIPNSVTTIQTSAFGGTGIEEMIIPDSVTNLEQGSLSNSTKKITFGRGISEFNTLGSYGFSSSYVTEVNIYSPVTSLPTGMFSGYSALTNVTLPNTLNSLPPNLFNGCSQLSSVNIPDSVTSIGYGAFNGCQSLTSINIPNGVISIGDGAFYYCSELTSIDIPDSVTSIGSSAFYGCNKITEIVIPDSVTSMGESAFYIQSLKKITFGRGLNSLGNYIRYYINNSNLEECHILCNISELPQNMFGGCGKLEKITLPNSLTSISNSAFGGCALLTTINIPDSVTSIGNLSFFGCISLTELSLPNSLSSIGDGAFVGCISLESINIPSSLTTINAGVFAGCTSLTLNIPSTVTTIYDQALSGCYEVLLDSNNVNYHKPNGYNGIIETNTHKLMWTNENYIHESITNIGESIFSERTDLTSITIPNSVTNIGNNAFKGCTSLTEIEIPNSVTSLGSSSLPSSIKKVKFGTGITNVTSIKNSGIDLFGTVEEISLLGLTSIPENLLNLNSTHENPAKIKKVVLGNSVTSIGDAAFEYCRNLTEINLPNSITSLGMAAFLDCTSLTEINLPNSITIIQHHTFADCKSLIEINIPNSVTSIEYAAFMGCTSLKKITISNSITSIERNAFENCANLDEITILSINPPTLELNGEHKGPFSNTNDCPIYVPAESVNAYKTAQYWTEYASRIQAIPTE